MAVPRPLLLALLGLGLVGATFYATRGAGSSEAVPPVVQPHAVKPGEVKTLKTPAKKEGKVVSKPKAKKVTKPKQSAAAARKAGLPLPVSRAMAQKRVVVLFFHQRGAADDEAAANAVAGLKHKGVKVSIFSDSIQHLGDYSQILSGVGVSQVPAIVIVGRDHQAKLIEGYVDPQTLAQEVADSR
jgi:hypothetical protein